MSVYTYTDMTLIINGQLVSKTLYELPLMDGGWHSCEITCHSASGVVQFWLDGAVLHTANGVQQGSTLPLAGAALAPPACRTTPSHSCRAWQSR